MAEEDLAAAYSFIAENHPAAVDAAGDREFQKQLESGYKEAQALAKEARTIGGYRAAIERFASAFGDPHIGSAGLVQVSKFWPGLLVGIKGNVWQVVAVANDKMPPVGATLLSCDGKDPDALATARLAPFTSNWKVRAEQIEASTSLLLDVGNPHQPRLTACRFRKADGETFEQKLSWQQVSSAELSAHLRSAKARSSRDVFIRPFDSGWWIRLGTSGAGALPILAQAEKVAGELRAAPFIVVDLRGNDGGASLLTDRLAAMIFGRSRTEAILKKEGSGETETVVWRASPGNLETVNAYAERARNALGADDPLALGMIAQRDAVARALADKTPLAKAPALVRRTAAPTDAEGSQKTPRVIVVTDRACFSSCLAGVRLFRKLGALHVGEETRANTRYSNTRSIELPTGLSNFYTLQAFPLGAEKQIGPFTPEVPFDGNVADDENVHARIRELVRSRE